MHNIVIPMAGAGSRFSAAGYLKPKPFIDVNGKPMIVRVLENLSLSNARYILIARNSHIQRERELVAQIEEKFNAVFIGIDDLTEGTACTVLHARHLINNNEPLLIANSDQIVDFDPNLFFQDAIDRNLDGSILVFRDVERNPKWSFAKVDAEGLVTEVREKNPISDYATVGIYLYRSGADFVESAIDMMLFQDKVNGEYYTCPTYNYMIKKRKKIGTYNIPYELMHGIGTPEDLRAYVNTIAHIHL